MIKCRKSRLQTHKIKKNSQRLFYLFLLVEAEAVDEIAVPTSLVKGYLLLFKAPSTNILATQVLDALIAAPEFTLFRKHLKFY